MKAHKPIDRGFSFYFFKWLEDAPAHRCCCCCYCWRVHNQINCKCIFNLNSFKKCRRLFRPSAHTRSPFLCAWLRFMWLWKHTNIRTPILNAVKANLIYLQSMFNLLRLNVFCNSRNVSCSIFFPIKFRQIIFSIEKKSNRNRLFKMFIKSNCLISKMVYVTGGKLRKK